MKLIKDVFKNLNKMHAVKRTRHFLLLSSYPDPLYATKKLMKPSIQERLYYKARVKNK